MYFCLKLLSASSWGCELKFPVELTDSHTINRQPLREAVSWNIILIPVITMSSLSASSWGCELKYYGFEDFVRFRNVSLFVRLWVEIIPPMMPPVPVIVSLFVRLWVEMTGWWMDCRQMKSASSWGCELKYMAAKANLIMSKSASSWGCELKYRRNGNIERSWRQPLREAVSWNVLMNTVP